MSLGTLEPLRGRRPRHTLGAAAPICQSSNGFQKTNPLPAGRYWIDIIGDQNVTDFTQLMSDAKALGIVKVESIEITNPSLFDSSSLDQKQAFVLFEVTGSGSISIDFKRFGFPTISGACVKSREDTAQEPDLDALTPKVPKWVYVAGGAVIVAFMLNALSNVSRAVVAVEEHT